MNYENAIKDTIIIGYSGHAYVICDIILKNDCKIIGYCEKEEKENNPFGLNYLGTEEEVDFEDFDVFVAIGDNRIREKIFSTLEGKVNMGDAYHPTSEVGWGCELEWGIMLGPNSTINSKSKIARGVIINSGAIVEHECHIGPFVHIAPGAVLAGNVKVGPRSFIGANAVIKQGINIGKDAVVGAGSVIINDVPDNVTVVGNPGRIIKSQNS